MNPFRKIVEIGLEKKSSILEKKRVRLLNSLSIIFVLVNLILGSFVIILGFETNVALVHFTIVPLQMLVMVLQHFKKYFLARLWMWLLTYIAIYYFSFFGDTTVNNEYYFAILALLPLIFFDRRWIHWLALGLSCLGFMSMDIYYLATDGPVKHMNNSSFILFTMLFLIVNFFKNLNEKQEKLMGLQRDKALQQTKIIESQKGELEELNRFQSKFFINISHELRTPLTLIGGAANMLSKSADKDNQNHLSSIIKQSDKIKQIVDDILDITKSKFNKLELNLQTINLNSLLDKIYSSFLSAFQAKSIELKFEGIENNEILLNADLIYLERTINNLLLNSLKYTSNNTGKAILSVSKLSNQKLLISIKDNGIGIKPKDIEKVFERFYQGENHINKSGGTGVGLSFAKDIIELHEGKIELISEEGKGAEIQIVLPYTSYIDKISSPSLTNSEKEVEQSTRPGFKGEKTILIVDDHEDMRNYIASLLPSYKLLLAENGKAALDQIKNNSIQFIITDYMMPEMDGYELVQAIKNQKIDVPILVLTARTDMDGKLDILRLGVDDYITKPFNQEELLIRIDNSLKNYLERKAFINEEKIESTVVEDPLLLKIKEYIILKADDTNFGLDDICIEFALSTSSLYRKIKSQTGLSSNEFVREIKLVFARELIESRKVSSLKELSFALGFSKPAYFSTLFEKRFGKKPF